MSRRRKDGGITMQQMMRTTDVSALLPNVLEPLVLNPGDGVRYRIASSLIRADPATRFFAIARDDEALIGDIFALEPEVSFVAYIERLADLPRWRSDWYAPLTTLPIAVYQLVDDDGVRIVTIQHASPTAFTATIVDAQGRRCGAVAPCTSVAAALECAQLGLVSDAAAAL